MPPNMAATLPTPATDPFRVLRKHMSVIGAAAVIGVIFGVAAWLALRRFYPLYAGTAQFEIVAALKDASQTTAGDLEKDDVVIRLARTEAAFLLSDGVLTSAMTHPEIQQTEWSKQFVDSTGSFQSLDALEELLDELVVEYVPDTNLFEAKWSAHEKRDVPIVLNTIQNTYLAKRAELEDAKWEGDLAVFDNQEHEIQREIDLLQDQIDEFVSAHSIFTLDQITSHPVGHELNSLNEQVADIRSGMSLMQTSYDQAIAKLDGEIDYSAEDRLAAEQEPSVGSLTSVIVGLQLAHADMIVTMGPDMPSVKSVETRLRVAEELKESRIREVIERNLNGLVKALRNSMEQSLQLLDELQTKLLEKDAQLKELAGKVSEYESLIQMRDLNMSELENVRILVADLKRLRQRTAADRVRLFTAAVTPRELSFPLPELMIPLGFLLVVGGTIGFIFLRELTDKRVKSASDLAIVPGAKVLGVIPDLQDDPTRLARPELAVREQPRSVIAESYRQTCTPILRAMERGGHQSLVVVGGTPGAGSTTVVTNIAGFIAAGGKRVVVVDGNFRRPTLAKAMGCGNGEGPGLGDLLADRASLRETIVSCGSGIDLIGPGTPANRVYERLNNGQIDAMLAELRSQYDYIVVDAPPALVAGDAMVLANRTDASILVVRAHQEQRGLVARLINQFSAAQSELLGAVLNRPRWTAGGYFKKNFATMAEYSAHAAS